MQSIGVLITCHNRKEKTIACLTTLYAQDGLNSRFLLKTYLTDDGCTDGTGDAVRNSFPQVCILQGDGNLYWCGGMRMAFDRAMQDDPDFYLWLNDDVELNAGAINLLLNTYETVAHNSPLHIVVGSTCDPINGNITYGGGARYTVWDPFKVRLVVPDGKKPLPCDLLEGNCVLLHRSVSDLLGNLDHVFTHGAGDTDYGLRALQKGCSIWVAPCFIGTCQLNKKPIYKRSWLSFSYRWKQLSDVKGYPIKEMTIFFRRHGGNFWIFYWIKRLVGRLLFPHGLTRHSLTRPSVYLDK